MRKSLVSIVVRGFPFQHILALIAEKENFFSRRFGPPYLKIHMKFPEEKLPQLCTKV